MNDSALEENTTQEESDVEVGTPSKFTDRAFNSLNQKKLTTEDVKEIYNHWYRCRNKWLTQSNICDDIRDNIDYSPVPKELKEREAIKSILKCKKPPYREFDFFYSLEEIIEMYKEIWFDELDDY